MLCGAVHSARVLLESEDQAAGLAGFPYKKYKYEYLQSEDQAAGLAKFPYKKYKYEYKK